MTAPRDPLESLRKLAPPAPPSDLRGRVLAHAVPALARRPERDRWSELRWSRPARWAWAAAVAVLALVNLLLPRLGRVRSVAPEESLASWRTAEAGELAEIVTLPRIDPGARSLVEAVALAEAEVAEAGEEKEP
jgi:hypothetical protein